MDRMLLIFVVSCVVFTIGSGQRDPRVPLTINEAKEFLVKYNYFGPDMKVSVLTDEEIEMGCRLFQTMANLPITGQLDNDTLLKMAQPRCGFKDIKTTYEARKTPLNGPQNYLTGSTWPKKALSWKITDYSRSSPLTHDEQRDAMARAFDIWAKQTPLRFRYVENPRDFADIDIRFAVGWHSNKPEEKAFDGPGRVLAHAFPPPVGIVHFDDHETWLLGPSAQNQGTELYITAAHEFGHALGLYHSNVPGALMFPYYYYSKNLTLHKDDIDGIQSLYGKLINPEPRTTPPPQPCNLQFQAAFHVESWNNGGPRTFIFADDESSHLGNFSGMYVHQLNDGGYVANSKRRIADLFQPLAPFRVDAAMYMPDTKEVYLIDGTRLLQYEIRGEQFVRTREQYLDTRRMPQKPQTAMVIPHSDGNHHYILMFGKTHFWDWHPSSNRVGGLSYPISQLGKQFPVDFQATILRNGFIYIFKQDKYYKFDPTNWRLDESYPRPVAPAWIRGSCGSANI